MGKMFEMKRFIVTIVLVATLMESVVSLKKASNSFKLKKEVHVVSHLGIEGCSQMIQNLVAKIRNSKSLILEEEESKKKDLHKAGEDIYRDILRAKKLCPMFPIGSIDTLSKGIFGPVKSADSMCMKVFVPFFVQLYNPNKFEGSKVKFHHHKKHHKKHGKKHHKKKHDKKHKKKHHKKHGKKHHKKKQDKKDNKKDNKKHHKKHHKKHGKKQDKKKHDKKKHGKKDHKKKDHKKKH